MEVKKQYTEATTKVDHLELDAADTIIFAPDPRIPW